MHLLNDQIIFPSTEEADDDGLLAIGGDLSPQRLLLAYRSGIFPWYNEGQPILWWSPNPRFVLYPEKLRVSKSMQQLIRSGRFTFTVNNAFEQVISNCKTINRNGQDGTWITYDMQQAFIKLHHMGHAHSAEAWTDGKLAGGLYGVLSGKVFCGESMFSKISNASKFAFIHFIHHLQQQGIKLIDCQVYTEHLASLGAEMIDRKTFLKILQQ